MRVHQKEILEEVVAKSLSICQVMKHLGMKLAGGSHSHLKKRIKEFGIDTSHFLGKAANCGKNHKGNKRLSWQEVLVKRNSGKRQSAVMLRRSLIELGREYRCETCENDGKWNDLTLVLEVDHKNNDWLDDRCENLRFLCPNCHSQNRHGSNKGLTSLVSRAMSAKVYRQRKKNKDPVAE